MQTFLALLFFFALIYAVIELVRWLLSRRGENPRSTRNLKIASAITAVSLFAGAATAPDVKDETEKDTAAAAKATPSPTPTPAAMPQLIGQTAAAATKQEDGGLVLAWAKDPGVHADKCRIVSQSVPAGEPIKSTAKVRCAIKVPASLKGGTTSAARTTLEGRGLKTKIANLPASGSTSGCRVRSWKPAQADPRETVALTVKCPKPTPKAPPKLYDSQQGSDDADSSSTSYAGQTCTEIGHSFNVPPGSDPDHDADGDGLACESQ